MQSLACSVDDLGMGKGKKIEKVMLPAKHASLIETVTR